MNAEAIAAIIGICGTIVSGVVGYIMHGFDKRVTTLELTQDKLTEQKLDKEDYYRDQGVMRASMTRIEDALINLPEKFLNLLKITGNLPVDGKNNVE